MSNIRTRIIKINSVFPEESKIKEAAEVIKRGGLVAFPTETVYGLGANCYNESAVLKIFIVKGRPPDNPLIVHISNFEMLKEVSEEIPDLAYKVANVAWPGPITVVMKKSKKVPYSVTGGLETVAVRMPAHPVALNLIEESGAPIAAPSANLSGRPSPTNAMHVITDLLNKVDVIIDSGETFFGVESTIIDVTREPPILLRPGPFTVEELQEKIGIRVEVPKVARGISEAEKALAPGMKYRHYAPKARMILVTGKSLEEIVRKVVAVLKRERAKSIVLATEETMKYYAQEKIDAISLGTRKNLYSVAKNLYSKLRECDEKEVELIICESFEERGIGLAIMNRLRKASGGKIV
ncbi:MAG: L-threonylcarbamoyladenylate synthase [Thermoproteota archaeon]|jgi:L-threonylcarbamoyladenylate synthase